MSTEVVFEKNENDALNVTIDTERLHMESVSEANYSSYCDLFSVDKTMNKFATGVPWKPETVRKRMNLWIGRWHENIPFSAFSLEIIEVDGVIGNIVLGYGSEPGSAELAYVIDHNYWGKRYGTESATALVKDYAPKLIERNYLINNQEFTKIVATARPDNPASLKILKNLGMEHSHEEKLFGNNRLCFFINTKNIGKPKKTTPSMERTSIKPS